MKNCSGKIKRQLKFISHRRKPKRVFNELREDNEFLIMSGHNHQVRTNTKGCRSTANNSELAAICTIRLSYSLLVVRLTELGLIKVQESCD